MLLQRAVQPGCISVAVLKSFSTLSTAMSTDLSSSYNVGSSSPSGLPLRLGFRVCVHVISYRNATVLCMQMGLRQSRAHCTTPAHIPISYVGHIVSCGSLGAPGRFEQGLDPSRASVWRWMPQTQRETVASIAGPSKVHVQSVPPVPGSADDHFLLPLSSFHRPNQMYFWQEGSRYVALF
ncbi:hypothetical protein ACQ4PT_037376 [Festuca glaucescens]